MTGVAAPPRAPWPLVRVVSGGQTGADQAGWRAAERLGYLTGGWMPHNFRTEDGHHPEFAKRYNARALQNGSYQERTKLNIVESHGTLIFGNVNEPGSLLTFVTCKQMRRPRMVVSDADLLNVGELPLSTTIDHVRLWVYANDIRVLNVAGNRESKHPGIGALVESFLIGALKQ